MRVDRFFAARQSEDWDFGNTRAVSRAMSRLDALGLFLARLINTFLALFVVGVIMGPGTVAGLLLLPAAFATPGHPC